MQGSWSEKTVAIAGTLLAVGGLAYLFIDYDSLIPALLIPAGAGAAIWATRKLPAAQSIINQDTRTDIGDILLLLGVLMAVLLLSVLDLPTKHDREMALLGPGVLFAAGALAKVYRYYRKFIDHIARTRKP